MALNLAQSQSPLLLEQEVERLLQWQDLVIRVLRNRKVSPVYRDLYIALFDTYPEVLVGQPVSIEPWRLRENAGWASESSATKFFQDMQAIGAFQYVAGKYDGKAGRVPGQLTPNPDLLPYPENFDTKGVERRRKAREAEEKRRKQFKNPLQIMQCEECGSNNLTWEATPTCQDCHHIHSTIKDIPASAITIDAEIIEIEDDIFLDEPTERVPVVPKTPRVAITQAELPAAPAVQFGKHPRNIACVDCGASNHWYAVTAEWGGTLHRCGICMPPEGGPHR